jgi:transposase
VRFRNWKDHQRYSLVLAAHCDGRTHHTLSSEHSNAASFARFITALHFSSGTTVVLDNARFHRAQPVLDAARRKGYTLLFTPPYSPELNPVELVFGLIKQRFYKARFDGADDLLTSQDATHLLRVIRASVRCVCRRLPSPVPNCFVHVSRAVALLALDSPPYKGRNAPTEQ